MKKYIVTVHQFGDKPMRYEVEATSVTHNIIAGVYYFYSGGVQNIVALFPIEITTIIVQS